MNTSNSTAPFVRHDDRAITAARVIEIEGGEVFVQRIDHPSPAARARTAVPGYAPTAGDDVVVAWAGDREAFVIGVLKTASGLRLVAPHGDLTLSAAEGRIVLESPSEVAIRSPEIRLVADAVRTAAAEVVQVVGRLELEADRVVERVRHVVREASELAETRAGRVRILVTGALQAFAGTTTLASEGDTAIDGERVLLG